MKEVQNDWQANTRIATATASGAMDWPFLASLTTIDCRGLSWVNQRDAPCAAVLPNSSSSTQVDDVKKLLYWLHKATKKPVRLQQCIYIEMYKEDERSMRGIMNKGQTQT